MGEVVVTIKFDQHFSRRPELQRSELRAKLFDDGLAHSLSRCGNFDEPIAR